jgi:hypothetical protein
MDPIVANINTFRRITMSRSERFFEARQCPNSQRLRAVIVELKSRIIHRNEKRLNKILQKNGNTFHVHHTSSASLMFAEIIKQKKVNKP